jgi:hypothetical protein
MSKWWNDYTRGYINRIPGTEGGNVRLREEATARDALSRSTIRPSTPVRQERQLTAADVMPPEEYQRWCEERRRKLAEQVKQEWQSFLQKKGIKNQAELTAAQSQHLKWLFHYRDSALGWTLLFSFTAAIAVFFTIHLSVGIALALSVFTFFATKQILLRPLIVPLVAIIWALHMVLIALGHVMELIAKIAMFVIRVVVGLVYAAIILAILWFIGFAIYAHVMHH